MSKTGVEERIDPADNERLTFEDLRAKYATHWGGSMMNRMHIQWYWEDCKLVKADQSTGDNTKVEAEKETEIEKEIEAPKMIVKVITEIQVKKEIKKETDCMSCLSGLMGTTRQQAAKKVDGPVEEEKVMGA